MSPLCSQKVFTQLRRSLLLSRPLSVDWVTTMYSQWKYSVCSDLFFSIYGQELKVCGHSSGKKKPTSCQKHCISCIDSARLPFFCCCFERLNIWGGASFSGDAEALSVKLFALFFAFSIASGNAIIPEHSNTVCGMFLWWSHVPGWPHLTVPV